MQRRDVILLKALSKVRQGLRPLSRFVLRVQPMTIEREHAHEESARVRVRMEDWI